MIKKLGKALTISMSVLLLTSCWDSEDINKKSITVSIGVDYVNDNIEFSGEVAKLASASKEEEKAETSDVYKMLSYGKTFEEARVNYDSVNPFSVFLGATRVVVFGEKYAKKGIEPYLNRIDHLYDYRKTLLSVVSREPPRELFNIKVEKDISVGFLIEDIMEHVSSNGEGLYPVTGELLSDIELGEIGYLLPYIGIEEGTIKYLGLAVMKNSKLIGIIDIKKTSGITYILAKEPKIIQIINSSNNEKNKISFRTFVKKRKIKTDYIDGQVTINIDLDLKAQLRYQYYMEPISDEYTKILENKISEKAKNNIEYIIKRAKSEFKCDIFGFARYFRAEHPEIYEKIDWEDAFTKANINVNVNTKIINSSLTDPNAKKKY
ncbi:Ger(x)C family spore germination protein [Tepidibacter hydrothermalis]|uniref:Ger(X)C family spore germination protein n=1 Tax=Tepidibacter hydrothermalis TaxID=3036126 RepID=A0ABY8EBN4_9FIRM|nr:Ger(x)C family spore germination protein [Tepidibacter hydrothermalis]WFD09194.1 Ger(x)C family spore germination protein [Tepidibacter hydrothermalis]